MGIYNPVDGTYIPRSPSTKKEVPNSSQPQTPPNAQTPAHPPENNLPPPMEDREAEFQFDTGTIKGIE